ncbi:MAG: three-Cys-motif partner protein TcmP [Planctomycetota bacterium]
MTDPHPTVYEASPHTVAKHRILEAYLQRWLPILDRQASAVGRTNHRLLYFDGFAGAGEYDGQVRGSPQVPFDVVEAHAHRFACPVEVRLIEKRSDRVEYLRKVISEKKSKLVPSSCLRVYDPIHGDCEEEVARLIQVCRSQRESLGPAFFFLDQFGYSSFSMDLIQSILAHESCETFSYLNWNLLFPFMSDVTKHPQISKAFGGNEWMRVLNLAGQEKENQFREIYVSALRVRGGAKYVYPFAMRGSDNRVVYWLFFCTNHIRGLEEMKIAMWSVDRTGGFEFSDKFADQAGALFAYTDVELADDLTEALAGEVTTVQKLFEYALVHTPTCRPYPGMKILERTGRLELIDPPVGRRRGSFKQYPTMQLRINRVQPRDPGVGLFGQTA